MTRMKTTVGVAWDGERISVVQGLKRGQQTCLEKQWSSALPAGSLEERAAWLKDRWKNLELPQDSFVLTFPRRKAIVRTLKLPVVKETELQEMLPLQAARETPWGLDEVVVDYEMLEPAADGFSKMTMVVVRKDDLSAALELFNAAGLHPSRVVIDSFLCLPLLRRQSLSEWVAVISEVEASGRDPLFSSALAAAMIQEFPARMNLLSTKEQRIGTRATRRRDLSEIALQACVLIILLAGTYVGRLHFRKNELAHLNQLAAASASQTQDLRRMESVLERARGQMSRKNSFLYVIGELNRLMPNYVSFRSTDFEGGRELIVDGTCRTLAQAVQFVELLQKGHLFSSVTMQSSNLQKIRDQDVVEFSLRCKVR